MTDSSDPFDNIEFDEAFVRSAGRREPSAAERAAAAHERSRVRRRERRRTWRRTATVRFVQLAVFGGLVTAVALVAISDDTSQSSDDTHGAQDMSRHGDHWHHGDMWTFDDPNGLRPTPRPHDQQRVLPPPDTSALESEALDSDAFEFLMVHSDATPIGYCPCADVEVVVSVHGAPDDAHEIVSEVLGELSAASGLSLVLDGFVNERAQSQRPPFQPERYGDRWAPVLIAWSNEDDVAELAGRVGGIGGSAHDTRDGQRPYLVSGIAYLDGPFLASIDDPDDRRRATRLLLLHELGHVLGLDHVSDPSQIMYAETNDLDELGAGDRAGLAALGSIECASVL